MSKDLLVLADEYAAATATFARALALKDGADSMSPIARDAGDKRAALAEALAALDTAQQEPSDLRGIDACPVAEWVDLVKRGYVSRDECLIAVKDIPLWIANNSEQAQPERAPLSDDEIQTIYLRTYNEGFHGRSLEIAFARAIEAAIKQGGQHD